MRTPQEPVGSGFGAASTTKDAMQGIDLSGKTAMVRKVGVMPHPIDAISAERLWSVSVEMTGASARP